MITSCGDSLFLPSGVVMHIDEDAMKDIRAAWQRGAPLLGNDKLKAQIEATLGRKVGENKRGRAVNERKDE